MSTDIILDHFWDSLRTSAAHSILLLLILLIIPAMATAETLTLKRALEIAFAKSPDIRQAGYSLKSSAENLRAQQASLKSQFRLSVTPLDYEKINRFSSLISQYNKEEIRSSGVGLHVDQRIKWTDGLLSLVNRFSYQAYSSEFRGGEEETSYNNQLSLTFTQPLFTYNRTRQSLHQLELALENAQLNYTIKRLEIESLVTRLFYDIHLKRMSAEIAEEEHNNSRESYKIIKNKVEAGISAQEELYQAELNLANARSSLENSIVTYDNGLDNFKISLGLPLAEEIEVIADVAKSVVAVNLEVAIEKACRYRMELRQHDISIENARFQIIRAGAENEFSGSVELRYGVDGKAARFGDLYDSPDKNQKASIMFNIPLWDWGEKKSKIAASQAQWESVRLSRQEVEKQIVFEIRQSYRALQNQLTQIDIAEANVRNAQLTYEINLERYKSGDISSKDIGYYQNQLSREQLNQITALINYKLALLDLKIRSLWDFRKNEPILNNQNQERNSVP
ncbi:MAG: TolC family protein [candidate division Zixibacteria bacterium]|nr:TolC family protein [candidate division Zixibacteria bacterium]